MIHLSPKVAIIIGSSSDVSKMEAATNLLDKLIIPYSFNILSAHRTPGPLDDLIKKIDSSYDCKVIIAGAGMSAALAGNIASKTIKPVIGVPLSGGNALHDFTALFSTVDMPPGIPVLTVGIDAAKNAALAAAQIIALSDCELQERLENFRLEQSSAVLDTNYQLQKKREKIFQRC